MQPHEYVTFAAALLDPARDLPSGLLVPAGIPVADRFAVHRNNIHASLVDALAERHPVLHALVGAEFFRAMARSYVVRSRPRTASLFCYGDDFASFIDAFAPAAQLPYLPDLAALENAWQESWGAPDAGTLTLAQLVPVTAEVLAFARFQAHPATHLLRSRWPVASIWQCHQQSEPDCSALEWRAENVLITRPHTDVRLTQLSAGTAALAAALLAGEALETAAVAALATAPDTDVGLALHALIEAGFTTEIVLP